MFPCSFHSTARHGKRGSAKQPAIRGSEGSRLLLRHAQRAARSARDRPGAAPCPRVAAALPHSQAGGAAAAPRREPRCNPARRGARGWRWAAAPPRGGAGLCRPHRPARQRAPPGPAALGAGAPRAGRRRGRFRFSLGLSRSVLVLGLPS